MPVLAEKVFLKQKKKQKREALRSMEEIGTAQAHQSLTETYKTAQLVPFDNQTPFVFFSDCHRRTRWKNDLFSTNEELFYYVPHEKNSLHRRIRSPDFHVHAVSKHLADDYDCFFTPYYGDGPLVRFGIRVGLLDFTILGGNFKRQTEAYLALHKLPVDFGGRAHLYDLVVTTSDILIQNNIRCKKLVLIQEGMTDPENLMTHLIRRFRLPRWMAVNTSTTGMSNAYTAFCVASEGYRRLFIKMGRARKDCGHPGAGVL